MTDRISILSRQLFLVGNNVAPEVREKWERSRALLLEFLHAEDGVVTAEIHDSSPPLPGEVIRLGVGTRFRAIHDAEKDNWRKAIQLPLPRQQQPLKRIHFMLALIFALHITVTPHIDHSITDSMRDRAFTAAVAQQSIGISTAKIPGTNSGRLACAAAVNQIVATATGQAIDASLDTPVLDADLSQRADLVKMEDALPATLLFLLRSVTSMGMSVSFRMTAPSSRITARTPQSGETTPSAVGFVPFILWVSPPTSSVSVRKEGSTPNARAFLSARSSGKSLGQWFSKAGRGTRAGGLDHVFSPCSNLMPLGHPHLTVRCPTLTCHRWRLRRSTAHGAGRMKPGFLRVSLLSPTGNKGNWPRWAKSPAVSAKT